MEVFQLMMTCRFCQDLAQIQVFRSRPKEEGVPPDNSTGRSHITQSGPPNRHSRVTQRRPNAPSMDLEFWIPHWQFYRIESLRYSVYSRIESSHWQFYRIYSHVLKNGANFMYLSNKITHFWRRFGRANTHFSLMSRDSRWISEKNTDPHKMCWVPKKQ